MAKFNVFVGRATLLSQIAELAEKRDTHLILISGVGGIGKTFLLQKVIQNYQDRADFTVDYYDLAEEPPGSFREFIHLVNKLGKEKFPRFLEEMNALDSGQYEINSLSLHDA